MTEKRLTDLEICKEIQSTVDEMICENNLSLSELVVRIDDITTRLIELDREKEELEAELVNKQGVLVAMVYKKKKKTIIGRYKTRISKCGQMVCF